MEQELYKLAKWKLYRFYSTNPAIVLPRKIHCTPSKAGLDTQYRKHNKRII